MAGGGTGGIPPSDAKAEVVKQQPKVKVTPPKQPAVELSCVDGADYDAYDGKCFDTFEVAPAQESKTETSPKKTATDHPYWKSSECYTDELCIEKDFLKPVEQAAKKSEEKKPEAKNPKAEEPKSKFDEFDEYKY